MNDAQRLPKTLRKGSRVAIVAPSSPAPDTELQRGLAALRGMGLEPVVGRSCTERNPKRGYLAGEDDMVKIDDIHAAFSDPSIGGIVCMRGGSGAGRLIRYLDAGLIASNPKVFVGYSDITILHCFIARNCGFVTFHGPMLTSDPLGDLSSPARFSFLRTLTNEAPLGILSNPSGCALPECLVPGRGEGKFVGGNLSLLATTIGTCAEIDTAGKIVFMEEVDEEPYSIDRLLNHLINAGKLIDAAGIVLGDFTDCDPPERYPDRTVQDVIEDVLVPLGIPLLAGLHVGHGKVNLAVPLGLEAHLDAASLTLRFDKPALSA